MPACSQNERFCAPRCPEFRHIHHGLAYAARSCFNRHKWLFPHVDCAAFVVADRAALVNAWSSLPACLRNQATQSGQGIESRDWQIPLGRRLRALKLCL